MVAKSHTPAVSASGAARLLAGIERASYKHRYLWYLLFLSLPLTHLLWGNIRPYEIVIIMSFVIIAVSGKLYHQRITVLDQLVFIFGIFMLLPVLLGTDSFYDSARQYRYRVLGPVLTYIVIRILPFAFKEITRGQVLFLLVVVAQTLLAILEYIKRGERPSGLTHWFVGYVIKYSFTVSLAIFFVLFTLLKTRIKTVKLILLPILAVLLLGLVVGASRGVLAPFMVMLFSSAYIWKSKNRRGLMSLGVKAFYLVFLFSVAFSPPKFEYDESVVLVGKDRDSLQRILAFDDYFRDVTNRMQFWSGVFSMSLDKPMLGHGTAGFERSTEIEGAHKPHHSHNMLMTSAYTSGLIGLTIFVLIIFSAVTLVKNFGGDRWDGEVIEKCFIGWFGIFMIVGLTNDINGGIVILVFFMFAMMQKIAIHRRLVVAKELSESMVA
ncbi:MAG: hypothetical protein P8H32_08350 [Oceanicoccus sp.]|uniref:O-antigen ligase family protein n=1 Tax=Oceanicoccus sp. TaxID=2691044 RepID=UPI00262980C6|nr:O-antigen ligase family protein [Oceanicoccus sp.]MDG1773427.1 hypothetical protein [Oceanicoccus sp.]